MKTKPLIPRTLAPEIERLRHKFPMLAITGPRQSGKTTLLRELFPSYRYISLENPEIRDFAMKDPNGFLKTYSEYVILDEVQQTPTLFSYLQTKTDQDKIMGQYILSGSQNFLLIHNISQSLAGRVAMLRLFPLTIAELKEEGLLNPDFHGAILKGGYPAVYARQIDPADFYPNYIETYIERDVRNTLAVRDLNQFRLFIRLCAGWAGQLLNLHTLASSCGVTTPTAKAWLSLLESSYLVFTLQPYYQNIGKRMVKTPKLYFYDTGIICSLLGIQRIEQAQTYYQKGALFENMIVADLYKQDKHRNLHHNFWFWRDSNGNEVDLVRERGGLMDLIEIKAGQTVNTDYFKGITYLKKQGLTLGDTFICYGGSDRQNRSDGTQVIGWADADQI